MKKRNTYVMPIVEMLTTEPSSMMALSLQSGTADTSDVLVKKDKNDWSIWENEED